MKTKVGTLAFFLIFLGISFVLLLFLFWQFTARGSIPTSGNLIVETGRPFRINYCGTPFRTKTILINEVDIIQRLHALGGGKPWFCEALRARSMAKEEELKLTVKTRRENEYIVALIPMYSDERQGTQLDLIVNTDDNTIKRINGDLVGILKLPVSNFKECTTQDNVGSYYDVLPPVCISADGRVFEDEEYQKQDWFRIKKYISGLEFYSPAIHHYRGNPIIFRGSLLSRDPFFIELISNDGVVLDKKAILKMEGEPEIPPIGDRKYPLIPFNVRLSHYNKPSEDTEGYVVIKKGGAEPQEFRFPVVLVGTKNFGSVGPGNDMTVQEATVYKSEIKPENLDIIISSGPKKTTFCGVEYSFSKHIFIKNVDVIKRLSQLASEEQWKTYFCGPFGVLHLETREKIIDMEIHQVVYSVWQSEGEKNEGFLRIDIADGVYSLRIGKREAPFIININNNIIQDSIGFAGPTVLGKFIP